MKTGSPNTLFSSSLTQVTFIILIITNFALKGDSKGIDGGKVKGMFVFGSSLLDNGNNNLLDVKAKCNYLPYGIDFKDGPTGRWSNGKTVIDVLSDSLGLPYIPPYSDPKTTGVKIINGVDFASGGSGILDSVDPLVGDAPNMDEQIQNFEKTLAQLEAQLGQNGDKLLQNYIFVVGSGANDYTMKYFNNATHGSIEDFTSTLILAFEAQLKKLYSLGARKFVLIAISPIGCYPANRNSTHCNEEYQKCAILFNTRLRSLIDSLPKELCASNFVFVDTFQITMDIINNPTPQGFQNVTNACFVNTCGQIGCTDGWHACPNRDIYVYFDEFHPTQAANLIIGSKAFSSTLPSDVYPINVQQLSMV